MTDIILRPHGDALDAYLDDKYLGLVEPTVNCGPDDDPCVSWYYLGPQSQGWADNLSDALKELKLKGDYHDG